MAQIFGTDIAGTIANAFSGQLGPATLTREVKGTYDPIDDHYEDEAGNPVEPTEQTYATEGVVTAYSKKMIAEGLVQSNDRQILLLAEPLETEPAPGDTIEIENETFTVVGTPERDPAGATYTVQGRL